MSVRKERTLKGLILIGLALFLTNSIIDGTLLFYINRRFAWLTWIATVLLLLMAYAQRRHPVHEHDGDSHDHHGVEGEWIAWLLVALPLLLGILVPPRPLGARAVGAREVNTSGLDPGHDERVMVHATTERDILEWLRAFGAVDDPTAFVGQEARVSGFVYRDETLADDQFMVSRFVVSCCVADATVLGLIVSWPGSLNLSLDTWVEVQGRFQTTQLVGEPKPILVADRVTPIAPPNQPYLYP